MSKKKSREYLMKLRKISDQGLIDPFDGDLGEFDGVTLKFVKPVSELICKYTGKPYTIQWQKKIEEMRDLYSGGRFSGRLCEDRKGQKLSGHPADQRKDPECRESKHRQDPCQCRDQDNDQRFRVRIL